MSADLFAEASEIVAGVAAMEPRDVGLGDCWFCQGWTVDDPDDLIPPGVYAYEHEPDCVWIRARRLTQLPVHPHKVRS